jgi:hypothetical protein
MEKVGAVFWREEVLVDFFKSVAMGAKCSRCAEKVWSLGSDAKALEACAEKLREQCPRGEMNEYVIQTT